MSARIGLPSRLIRRVVAGPNVNLTCRVVLPNKRAPLSTGKTSQTRGRFLTVAFTPENYTRQKIVTTAHSALASYNGNLGRSKAAVVLVSRSLAPWIDDAEFLSHLLSPWRGDAPEMDILVAVVDSVRVPQDFTDPPPSEGLAVMAGESVQELLPGLWEEGTAAPGDLIKADKASLEFQLPPLSNDERPLHVTLPLANTVFTNGRPHTMFAARLTSEPETAPTLTSFVEKSSQVILTGRGPRYYSSVSSPLVPITQARKIVTGLGNILRQVEVDGKPTGASLELEEYIPKFLEARSSSTNRVEERPLTVWAAIYPEGHFTSAQQPLPPLQAENGGSIQEEVYSRPFKSMMPDLLAAGCHIRQVLSGGGGWGSKAGLLSLDPETKYSTQDHEDVESFIRSFKGEESTGSGIVTPGSWVQFMVERATLDVTWQPQPRRPYQELKKYENTREVVNLGVRDEVAEEPMYSTIRVSQDYFGVSSSLGLYIASPADTRARVTLSPISTKVSVPRTELVSFL